MGGKDTRSETPESALRYPLGHDRDEWDRLSSQHTLWRETILSQLGGGVNAGCAFELRGSSILEVGCGGGDLLVELADLTGPTGRCRGIDVDPRAIARARRRLVAVSLPWVELSEGDLLRNDTSLDGPWNIIVARWVLSFLPDPGEVIRRLAAALEPGGKLVIQDYNHDGVRIFPAVPSFDRVMVAWRAEYAARGGDLFVAGRVPGLMRWAGLDVTSIDPRVIAGPPHSDVWRWVEAFVFGHMDTITAPDGEKDAPSPSRLSADERFVFEREWAKASDDADSVLFSPMQVCVVGVKPSLET